MTNRSALALAFATGYVAGRSRIKLPLGMGGALLARRLGVDPGRLGEQFKERTPQLAEATGRLRNNVRQAGRAATGALPTERLEALTGGVRGQLGRAPWKSGGKDASDAEDAPGGSDSSDSSGASERKPRERSGKDANGSRSTGASRKESADSGKSAESGQGASRRAPAKKTASRTAKKTASASRKPAGAAKKSTGSAGKQTGKSAGSARKTTGTAKRTGGSERG
ncbi:hypothetical protein ACG5V6_11775 [Streptomyces chitinivorans]|uniref:DNA primase n=1 Tax=Streptomyces chitinivorans TaxID=1257027 RepID=A0ABW7HSM8_9ACTN|nr:hypothetical protein [Streptomyces chitinivorans]MDH2411850.1 hypothetical protein [Streptomyces chitinivorans]